MASTDLLDYAGLGYYDGKIKNWTVSDATVAAAGSTTGRTLPEHFADVMNAKDFGAKGDGTMDDTAAFAALEQAVSGRVVNLCGNTYAVTADADGLPPHGNRYVNGSFAVTDSGTSYTVIMNDEVSSRHDGVTSSGIGSWPNWFLAFPGSDAVARASLSYDADENRLASHINDVTAIGYDALHKSLRNTEKRCASAIAIGAGVMSEGASVGPHNIGIGAWALHDLERDAEREQSEPYSADRNVAIGTLCYPHVTSGRCNVGLGRDVGQSLTTGSWNSCIGYGAMGGFAPVGLDGTITNEAILKGDFNVALGAYSLHSIVGSSSGNVAIGAYSALSAKNSIGNIFIGRWCGRYIDYYTSVNGKKLKRLTQNNTVDYLQAGVNLQISLADSGAVVGGYVLLTFRSGAIYDELQVKSDSQTMYVTATDAYGFTVSSPERFDGAAGRVTVTQIELADEEAPVGALGTALIGYGAAQYIQKAQGSNVIGAWAVRGTALDDIAETDGGAWVECSNVIGSLAAMKTRVSYSDVMGYGALRNSETYSSNPWGNAEYSVVLGTSALRYAPSVSTSVVAGYAAGENIHGNVTQSVVIGSSACRASTSGVRGSVVLGNEAGNRDGLDYDVFIGRLAGTAPNVTSTQNCVAIGHLSFRDSGITGAIVNSIAIGRGSAVSGSNQCQLGDSNVTTYAYGSVQDRSDARDKADIRDTELGLDFLLSLRPVDFKWDYRDDYIEAVEREVETTDEYGNVSTQTEIDTVRHEKDGSRKRNRYHHGLIAQEVKAVLDAKGIDFGGYQDHKINGGADVLTIGYEEFIGPIIKAIQEIDARLSALEA